MRPALALSPLFGVLIQSRGGHPEADRECDLAHGEVERSTMLALGMVVLALLAFAAMVGFVAFCDWI